MWIKLAKGLLLVCMLLAYVSALAAASPPKNWRTEWWLASQPRTAGEMAWLVGDGKNLPIEVPLGSLWKLLMYIYQQEQALPDKPYVCHAGKAAQQGDEYCCIHDEPVTRNTALARSCGAYFQPQRLAINADDWQGFWQQKTPQIAWVQQLDNLRPQTTVPVRDILAILNSATPTTVANARQALLGRLLQPQWSELLPYLGGAYRFKTFTWQHPWYRGAYMGGAAGWLADGTAFWLGGSGGSRAVTQRAAVQLAQALPITPNMVPPIGDNTCVSVRYFRRYPISRIEVMRAEGSRTEPQNSRTTVANGVLRGDYRVQFTNGNWLTFRSQGELSLTQLQTQPQIWGKLPLQEYVARVVDREADATQTEAAKALSIAARSYVYQNAHFHQGCWQMDDDSRTQRVSPNAASNAARKVAAFTEDLSLTGAPVYYHQNKSADNTLNWQQAVQQAQTGQDYLALLRVAYPQATWRLGASAGQCRRLYPAEQYIAQNLNAVRPMLNAQVPGWEPVNDLKMCELDYGNPYADAQTASIYVRNWRSENDRITLWHEYLHLALRFHPNGQDEAYIEKLARQLTQAARADTQQHLTSGKKVHHAQ